jgi:hypothetical protein
MVAALGIRSDSDYQRSPRAAPSIASSLLTPAHAPPGTLHHPSPERLEPHGRRTPTYVN